MWKNLLRKLSLFKFITWKRGINLLRLYFYHNWGTLTGRIKPLSPYALSMELSSVCNLNCPQCPVGLGDIHRTQKYMDITFARRLINEFSVTGLTVNLYFQGESLLYPHLFQIAALARKKRLYSVLSTNATLIDEEKAERIVRSGINRLIISLDGLKQDTYEQYRSGGHVEDVWQSIGLLSEARTKQKHIWPEIIVQTLVNRNNEHELEAIEVKALSAGADKVKFKTMQIYTDHEQWLPKSKRYRRYSNKELNRKPRGQCFRSFSGMVVTADEQYLPCCYDKQAQYSLSDASESLLKVTKSEKRKAFLEHIYQKKVMHDICQNCPEAMCIYKKRKTST